MYKSCYQSYSFSCWVEDFALVDRENPTGNLEHLVYVKTFFPQMTNLKFSQITIFT